jgi:hypothetical protein
MIEFSTVTQEFRSLVERRRELFTFLGSAFAALGLFLHNSLQGGLPDSLKAIQQHVFAHYAFALMVISLILALRMAKLHGGMVLNGIATRHNWFGVSFLQFILVDLIAGFSAAILALALALHVGVAIALGVGVFVLWVVLYFRFHREAGAFALRKIAEEKCAPFARDDWEAHVSASLQQANQGMISEIAFAGLMVFSVFAALSSLGKIGNDQADLTAVDVKRFGPFIYGLFLVVTCLLELIIYLRVRVAAGHFCVELDPTDRPFRPLRLTDSLLGYLLQAFLFALAVHVFVTLCMEGMRLELSAIFGWNDAAVVSLGIACAAFLLAVLAEQWTLVVMGRRLARK